MFSLPASADAVEKYRSNGWWRDTGLVTDRRRWRDTSRDAMAIDAFGSDGQRFAGALYELRKVAVLGQAA
jgi:hypothetical protein